MKSKEMLAVKFIEIDRQHTPTPRICSSRAKGVDIDPEDQAKSRVQLFVKIIVIKFKAGVNFNSSRKDFNSS